MMTPDQKRSAAAHLQSVVLVGRDKPLSQRQACHFLGLNRRSARTKPVKLVTDEPLLRRIELLAQSHPRYGYRRIHALLRREARQEAEGCVAKRVLNIKRVHRLWKRAARQVPPRKKKRGHFKNKERSVPQQALYPGHVWSYDFVHDACRGGAKLKRLCVNDEFTRQCHAIEVAASLTAKDVQSVLENLFQRHGAPTFLRSDVPALRQRPGIRAKRPQSLAQGAKCADSVYRSRFALAKWQKRIDARQTARRVPRLGTLQPPH